MASDHYFEYCVAFNNETAATGFSNYTVLDISANYHIFSDNPVVGGCLAAELNVSLLKPSTTIPRMAKVRPYVRVTNGTTSSEWVPQGVFYIDTRETTNNNDGRDILTIHAYDAMLKTEADYPSTTHSWPTSDINVVKEIAREIGLQSSLNTTTGLDDRTVSLMNKGYQIGLPAGYSMREVLSNIAAMYGGNWVMNYAGKLLLVAINGIPPETNYLIDGTSAITFGGDRILV